METLIYNGMRDTAVPAVGAEQWVPRVAGAVAEPRRPWSLGAGPGSGVAGHVTRYARGAGLTFVTVQGAGHLVPADRPEEGRALVATFLAGGSLPAYTGKACQRLWAGRGYSDFCA